MPTTRLSVVPSVMLSSTPSDLAEDPTPEPTAVPPTPIRTPPSSPCVCQMPTEERQTVGRLYNFLVEQRFPVEGWPNLTNPSTCVGYGAMSTTAKVLTLNTANVAGGCYATTFTASGSSLGRELNDKKVVPAEEFFNIMKGLSKLNSLYMKNALHGTLPPAIGKLRSLTYLGLDSTALNGTLPPAIGNLTALQYLQLSNNQFNGTLPPAIGNLRSLTYLKLVGTTLNGTLPPAIGNLRALTLLQLSNNLLSGQVPTVLGHLTALKRLDVSSNKLSGVLPSSLGMMVSLITLELQNNRLSRSIPAQIGLLTKLNVLRLNTNKITGTLPPAIGNLTALQYLQLSNNQFNGTLPPSIGNLRALTLLQLSNNLISGQIPTVLGHLTALKRLALTSNKLSGVLPSSVGSMLSLTALYCDSNSLSGSLPTTVGNMSSLVALHCSKNYLSGSIPAQIGLLTKLNALTLGTNKIAGYCPSSLGMMVSLIRVELQNNRLTGSLPVAAFALQTALAILDVSHNRLRGSLPSIKSKKLNTLDCSNNSFSGSLPLQLWLKTNLSHLNLSHNGFSGSLPTIVGNLLSLSVLGLGSNFLNGSIPSQLGRLTKLEDIALDNNSLTGTLTANLGNMVSLTSFGVGHNKLSGTIPIEFKSLKKLQVLRMEHNNFQGSIPDIWVNFNTTACLKLNLAHNNLNGSLPASLMSLRALHELHLTANSLTGRVDLSRLSSDPKQSFQILILDCNKFSGTVPIFPSSLRIASLQYNQFSGTIPSEIGGNTVLEYLEMRYNSIIGTIPQSLWGLSSLTYLCLFANKLSGTLDSGIGRLTGLKVMILGLQPLTRGTLPNELGRLTNLKIFNVRNMQLSGQIPSSLGNMKHLVVFNASGNALVGTLPSELANMENMRQMSLYSNKITGTLPQSLSRLSNLEQLIIYENKLSGSADVLFQNNSFPKLKYVDISSNHFNLQLKIKTVPPKLRSFAAYVNCFSGEMDIGEICGAAGLETLLLDGISCSIDCLRPYWYNSIDLKRWWDNSAFHRLKLNLHEVTFSASKNSKLTGTLPSCLFSLEHLNTLHLSANNLQGQLPDIAALPSNLTNLRLSLNFLKGTIPQAFQRDAGQLQVLDLSANRFTGTIEEMAAPSGSIYLFGNRLSGRVSRSIAQGNFDNVSVLSGNLFECRIGNRNDGGGVRDLPEQDPEFKRFPCGSNNLEIAILVFLGFGLVIAAVAVHQVFYLDRFQRLRRLLTRNFFRASSASVTPLQLDGRATERARSLFMRTEAGNDHDDNDDQDQETNLDFNDSEFFGRISLMPPLFRSKTNALLDAPTLTATADSGEERKSSPSRSRATRAMQSINRDDLHAMNFVFLLSDLRAISIFLGLVTVSILLPLYLLLKLASFGGGLRSFKSFRSEYLWTASGIFIKGSAPAFILCFTWIALIVVAFQLFHFAFRRQDSKRESQLARSAENLLSRRLGPSTNLGGPQPVDTVPPPMASSSLGRLDVLRVFRGFFCERETSQWMRSVGTWFRILVRNTIIVLITCTASLSLNFFYIAYYQSEDLDPNHASLLQVFVAVSKLSLSRIVPALKSLNFLRLGLQETDLRRENDLEVFLALFNLIAAPFIATALTEKSCFLSTITGTDSVYLKYELVTLTEAGEAEIYLQGNGTSQLATDTLFRATPSTKDFNFVPPFIYYYTCSSSLIRIYSTPIIISSIIKIFFTPITSFLMRYLLYALPAAQDWARSEPSSTSSSSSSSKKRFHQETVDQKAKMAVDDTTTTQIRPRLGVREVLRYACISCMPKMLLTEPERDELQALTEALGAEACKSAVGNSLSFCFRNNDDIEYTAHFLDASRVLLDVFVDIVVILTFGVLCPLLALILLVSVSLRCTRFQYMCENILRSDSQANWEFLNLDCARAWKRQMNMLFKLRWMIVVVPGLFFTIFIFDTARDDWLEDYDHSVKPVAKALVCCVAILPLFLSLGLTRAAPSFFASAAHRVVRGEFGVAEIASRVSQRISRKVSGEHQQEQEQQQQQFSGSLIIKNPMQGFASRLRLSARESVRDEIPLFSQRLVPVTGGGYGGNDVGDGDEIELVTVVERVDRVTPAALQGEMTQTLADSCEGKIRERLGATL